MLLQSAVAQEQQPTEKVIVTGSAIPRTEVETPAPVQVITAEEIAKTGKTTVQEVLQSLTANGANNLSQGFSGAFAGGAAGVALRGMTVDATLVLIDGHRMAPYPISDDGQRSFVDVANLPLSIIERIEVLKDSGSALYGSDAIAGVVNIITRKSFVGSVVAGDYGQSTHNDGITYHVAATHGWGDLAADGHNTYMNIEYRHQNEISNHARSAFSNYDYYHEFGPAAGGPTLPGVVQPGDPYGLAPNLWGMVTTISGAGTSAAKVGPAVQLPGCKPHNDPLGGCGYDPSVYFQIQPETENLNLWIRHAMQLTPDWQVVGTASVFKDQAQQLYTPRAVGRHVAWASINGTAVNTGSPKAQPIVLPPGNVNNPFCPKGSAASCTTSAWLNYVFGDLGATDNKFDTSTYRLAIDLNGPLLGFDTSTSIGWVRGISDISYYNFPLLSGLKKVIAANDYYIGANAGQNTAAVLDVLAPTTQSVATSQMQYVEFNVNRDLPYVTLPGGPIGVAAGVSVHHWGQDDPGQPGAATGDTIGLGTTFIYGTETDQAAHAEISLLPVKMLELDGQIRFDKVVGTGSRISPKGSFKLTPIQQVALRGTYSRGFRAPGPGEKGNSGVTFFETAPIDPIRCPVTGLPTDCGKAPGGAVFGAVTGNPQLQPERSEAYDLGIVLEPIKNVSLSADWYKIRRTDYIYNGPSATFIRGPAEPPFLSLPGPIIGVAGPYINLGSDVTSGLEFDGQAKVQFDPIGTISMHTTWTHLLYYDYCGLTFGGVLTAGCVDIAGSHGPEVISGNTGTPKDRGNAVFALDQGPWEAGFTINYVSGYDHTDPTLGVFGDKATGCFVSFTSCHVSSFTDVDLFGHYDLSKQFQVTLHVLNIFDRDAPFDPEAQYDQNNYSVNWAQQGAVGRFVQAGFRYTF